MAGESDDEIQQNQEIVDHIRTAEDIIASSRNQRATKRKAIEDEFSRRIEAFRSKMMSLYETRDIKVKEAQNAQWERLQKLVEDRIAVESRIFAILKLLEQAQLNLSRELMAMYDGRLEEIRELTTTGKTSSG